jgi:hypothetical protein
VVAYAVALLGVGAVLAITLVTAREPATIIAAPPPVVVAEPAVTPPRLAPPAPAQPPPASPSPPIQPVQRPAAAVRSIITPEVVARSTQEARAQLEVHREAILSSCWPASGLPGGRKSAKLTLNVTFDAQGREIARGIVDDRKAPAGPFARCLQNLPQTKLSIEPPGANVAISMAVAYP